jgi:hypothetical protein
LSELTDLPPLNKGSRLGRRPRLGSRTPTPFRPDETDGEAHAIPIETSLGRWYVMVILKTDKKNIIQKASQPLIYTLLILLFSTAIDFSARVAFHAPDCRFVRSRRGASPPEI